MVNPQGDSHIKVVEVLVLPFREYVGTVNLLRRGDS